MNRKLIKYLEEYIQAFSLTEVESEQARINLMTVTSEYYKGRDPKLIAWTACNMVLKRRRDGYDSKERSEYLGFDPKKVAQIEWRIVKSQTDRGEMPPDRKSDWVDSELKDIFGQIMEKQAINCLRATYRAFIINVPNDTECSLFSYPVASQSYLNGLN